MIDYGKSVSFSTSEINKIVAEYYDAALLNHLMYGFVSCWCGHPPAVHFNDTPINPNKLYPCKIPGCQCECVAIDNLTYIEIMAKEKRLV